MIEQWHDEEGGDTGVPTYKAVRTKDAVYEQRERRMVPVAIEMPSRGRHTSEVRAAYRRTPQAREQLCAPLSVPAQV
jgi:hypothetical protein